MERTIQRCPSSVPEVALFNDPLDVIENFVVGFEKFFEMGVVNDDDPTRACQ
jgi:hypothetical protein